MGGEAMDIHTAVQEVLKNAMVVDGLVRGLREAVKALDKRKAHLCILAANCDEPSYVKLVEALCVEHNIPMFKVRNVHPCRILELGSSEDALMCLFFK